MIHRLLKWLGMEQPVPSRPAPSREQILGIMATLPFPHGHLALGSLLALQPTVRDTVISHVRWLDAHRTETEIIMQKIAADAKTKRQRSNAGLAYTTLKPGLHPIAPMESE